MDYFERKHQEDLQRLRGFRLLDDDFMTKVFEDKGCTELLLQIILERDDLKVLSVHTQREIKNLQGHSVRLDVHAEDEEGCLYDVEIQRSDKGAVAERARYNSALIDANALKAGKDYKSLAETYVIFITENDVMKRGLPIYHIDRVVAETGELFGDKAHIIYVNSEITDETSLGRLMHDFRCVNAEDMHYSNLSKRVDYFKNSKEGVEIMCREMEQMREAARKEGQEEERERMAKLMGILMEAEDYDVVKQVVSDPKLCEKYYERYGI